MKCPTRARLAHLCAALMLGSAVMSAQAVTRTDDTEVYTKSGEAFAAPPIVMFYIEYAANLGSDTSCTSLTANGSNLASQCPDFAPLAPYFVYPNDPTALTGTTSTGATLVGSDFSNGKIERFELIRAALKRVLIAQEKAMKIGIVAAHADETNCAGYNEAVHCSNGAYILSAARMVAPATQVLNAAGIDGAFEPTNTTHIATVLANDPERRELLAKLNRLPTPGSSLWHHNQSKEVYFELYRYLAGKPIYNGHNGWNDYTATTPPDVKLGESSDTFSYTTAPGTSGTFNTQFFGPDSLAELNGNYVSPLDQNCQRVFMITVANGAGNQQNDSDTDINKSYAEHGLNMTVANENDGFAQVVGSLYDLDLANAGEETRPGFVINPRLAFADKQNVTSFFFAELASQYNDAADEGGTGSAITLTYDPADLVNKLNKVFSQILSVSTTFVAASIPVNVFNRSEVIDNAYLALFQADKDGKPAWYGDVKKLKLAINADGDLYLKDYRGNPAIGSDGRIAPDTLTFWTNSNGYDITDTTVVTGADPAPAEDGQSDGRAVSRGGSGQKIPGFLNGNVRGLATWSNSVTGARKLYTQNPSTTVPTANGLIDLQWSSISSLWPYLRDPGDTTYSTLLWPQGLAYTGSYTLDGALTPSPTERCFSFATTALSATTATSSLQTTCRVRDLASNVMAYIRGYDVKAVGRNDNETASLRLNTRRWIMGDPLHSRPLPINYGARAGHTQTNPDIRIVVGSNDGFLRMVKNTDSSGSEMGREMWAFMPLDVIRTQKQLMDNNIDPTHPEHPYGVDGSPVAYVKDSNGTIDPAEGDLVQVFFGLRRGGRGYYSLDITNPDAPVYKWGITQRSPGFGEIGYTFSQPVLRYMNWGAGAAPVLIFGGGYDTDKDITGLGTDDDMGRAIYIVNALDGALVWKVIGGDADADYSSVSKSVTSSLMTDSIPSEVTAIDSNSDGCADRVYVGDTGGKVWRVDLPGQPICSSSTPTTGADPRASWKASVLLNLGRHYINDTANDRRFFYAPDVVPSKDSTGNFDAVVIGSGNREHPLGTINNDYMFMFKDRNIYDVLPDTFAAVSAGDLYDTTNNCLQTGTCSLDTALDGGLNLGWKLRLTDAGEKSLASATTLRGVVYFSTYVPASTFDVDGTSSSCTPEGDGYFYAITLDSAQAHFSYFSSLNETTGELTTEDRKRDLKSHGIPSENVYVSFRDGDRSYSGILPSDLDATENMGAQRWQTYWYEKNR